MHCYYAMNGLSVNNFGRVRPCCVAKTFKSISGAPGVINSHDLDYINTWPIKMDMLKNFLMILCCAILERS